MIIRGAIYGLSAAAIWGGMYVVSDVVLNIIPPFTLLAIRLVMAMLILGVILWWQGKFRMPPAADLRSVLGVGLVGFGISLGAQFVGTEKSTAVNGALVTTASPAFILIFAAWILHERLTLRRVAAVVLASLGVLVIIDPTQADFGSATFAGDVMLAVAAVTWGLYSVLVRQVSARMNTLLVTFWVLVGGLILVLPAALVELTTRPIGVIDTGVILGVLYVVVISTAVAMWLWNRAFALVDASVASLFFFAQPLVGALLAVLLLGQEMTVNLWGGSVLITLGVLLALMPRGLGRKAPQPHLSKSQVP
ncbi:MAG: DMT family transporter [Anaerolineae bacterium]|nr:DMT family transporter [Anaerolineae bacterium]